MFNLQTRKFSLTNTSLKLHVFPRCARLCDVYGTSAAVYLASVETKSDREIVVVYQALELGVGDCNQSLPLEPFNLSDLIRDPTVQPVSLELINGGESAVIAFRTGELVELAVGSNNAEIVGDVTDPDAEKSGILTIRASHDGCMLVVVSPKEITIMSSGWDIVGAIPLDKTGVAASVSWRGDDDFFVVTVRGKDGTCTGFVVDRDCRDVKNLDVQEMQADGEPLQELVGWQPRAGGFICHAGPGYSLSFFERNGLRHLRSDFSLIEDEGYAMEKTSPPLIDNLTWSADSEKLAVASSLAGDYFVDVYSRSNYKWYRKRRVAVSEPVSAILWDEDDVHVLRILLLSGKIIELQFQSCSSSFENTDGTHAAVIDGCSLLLTNLTQAVIPPPMCHSVVVFRYGIEEICELRDPPSLGVLLCNGRFYTLRFKSNVTELPSRVEVANIPSDICVVRQWNLAPSCTASFGLLTYRHPILLGPNLLAVVKYVIYNEHVGPSVHSPASRGQEEIVLLRLDDETDAASYLDSYSLDGRIVAVSSAPSNPRCIFIGSDSGNILLLDAEERSEAWTLCNKAKIVNELVTDCISIAQVSGGIGSCCVLSHGKKGNLLISDLETGQSAIISRECTSFAICQGFLTFTTRGHVLFCVPISSNDVGTRIYPETFKKPLLDLFADLLSSEQSQSGQAVTILPEGHGATRPIDRGSRIVTSMRNDVSLVLQAPRGNLESIAPRPIVQVRVCELALRAEYGEAFALSRQQRVDMNLMVDVDPEQFLSNISTFVTQVPKASHICIFLTFLKGNRERINAICDAIVKTLQKNGTDRARHVTTLLTAFIRKDPPDYEAALNEIWEAHKRRDPAVMSHLDFLFVLCKDEEAVYGHALGSYNLSLAVLVAKGSKLDPAEYTLELQGLKNMNDHRMKYTIDMKIKRYEKALRHLFRCGEQEYKNCIEMAKEYFLFPTALELFEGHEEILSELRREYGKALHSRENFVSAAVVFVQNRDAPEAAQAYLEAGKWELAVAMMQRASNVSQDRQKLFFSSVAENLAEQGKIVESCRVRVSLLGEVDGALDDLLSAEEWSAVIEIVCQQSNGISNGPMTLENRQWKKIEQAVVECSERLIEDLTETMSKMRERRKRLDVVRQIKAALREKMQASGVNEAGSDVLSATTASSIESNVSDLTFISKSAATSVHTSLTKGSKAASAKQEKAELRRKNKSARKRIREGHPQEEEYLQGYLRKLVPTSFLHRRVEKLVDALLFARRLENARKIVAAMRALCEEATYLPEGIVNSQELVSSIKNRVWDLSILKTNGL